MSLGLALSALGASSLGGGIVASHNTTLFDGVDDNSELREGIFSGLTKLSIVARIFLDNTTGTKTIYYEETSTVDLARVLLDVVGDEVRILMRDSDSGASKSFTTTTANLSSGVWYAIIATIDTVADEFKIHIGATEHSSSVTMGTIYGGSYNRLPRIGSTSGGSEFFKGSMFHVKAYNFILSSGQRTELQTAKIHRGYSTGLRDSNCLFAFDGAKNLPTSLYEDDLLTFGELRIQGDTGIVDVSTAEHTFNNIGTVGVEILVNDVNEKDVLDFDGSSYLESTDGVMFPTNYTSYTNFYVAKFEGSGTRALISQEKDGVNNGVLMTSNRADYCANNDGNSLTVTEDEYKIYEHNLTTAGVASVKEDDIILHTDTVASPNGSPSATDFQVGRRDTAGSGFMTGKIAVLMCKNVEMTADQKQACWAYLVTYYIPQNDLSESRNNGTLAGGMVIGTGEVLAISE